MDFLKPNRMTYPLVALQRIFLFFFRKKNPLEWGNISETQTRPFPSKPPPPTDKTSPVCKNEFNRARAIKYLVPTLRADVHSKLQEPGVSGMCSDHQHLILFLAA